MKKIYVALFASLLLSGMAKAQVTGDAAPAVERVKAEKLPAFSWNETTHEFGKIPQGQPVTITFTFKNSGKAPLILSNAVAGCGCTNAEFTREPVKPGKQGFVKVTYNAASPGPFTKSVAVTSNVSTETVVLLLRGEVVPDHKTPEPAP